MQRVITTHEIGNLISISDNECYANLAYGDRKIKGKTVINPVDWATYNASAVIRASNSKRARLRTEAEEEYQAWIAEPLPVPMKKKVALKHEADKTHPYSVAPTKLRTVKKKKDKATKVADKLVQYQAREWQVPSAVT